MSYFRIEYFSNALCRRTSFDVLIPNDRGIDSSGFYPTDTMHTLFLLHGYTGKAGNWVPEDVVQKYRIAIVMPNAENSFYLNGLSSGHAYQTMVGEELVDYVRKTFHLARCREDTFIAGMSMGGFGALHTGLAYPETFGKIAALSSALIVHSIAHMKPGDNPVVANYDYYRECFGDLETVESRETNPEVQIQLLKARGGIIPDIFMCCGTEDFLLEGNRSMHEFLLREQIEHTYYESSGNHDMAFWSEYIVKAVEWMFRKA